LLKLLFATLGTLGDIRPSLAIAAAAARRGHAVTFASTESFRSLVEGCGLHFESFGSDLYFEDPAARNAIVGANSGFASFMALSNLQDLESMFWRLDALAAGADCLVSTPLVMAAHLVAQKRQLPLVSCAISPAVLLAQWGMSVSDPYSAEWRSRLTQLRGLAGLPRRSFPQMDRFSGDLMLGIYPICLTATEGPFIRAPREIGYPSLDEFEHSNNNASDELLQWMKNGRCVIVSFGSFVDAWAVQIFDSARQACAELGLRLLFVSKYRAGELAHHQTDEIRVVRYVAHREVMAQADIVVHHCGVGSLAAAVASRRPMIGVPFGLDQTYNAEVLRRRDLAEILPGDQFSYETFSATLTRTIARWPQRKALWEPWLDDSCGLSAQKGVDEIEALATRRSSRHISTTIAQS